jgi:hypothetical protein
MTVLYQCKGPSKQLHVDFLGAARRLMEINSRIELEQPKHVRLRREYGFAAQHEGLHKLEPCFAHIVLHLCNL